MKKVGIVTHYYKSTNYGGVLQSYALVKYLNDNKINAKQICYRKAQFTLKKLFANFVKKVFIILTHPIYSIVNFKKSIKFAKFRRFIPHYKICVTDSTVKNYYIDVDALITGSDQVWNPQIINHVYCLEFPLIDCIKLSYAASVASNFIPENKIAYFRNLNNLDYVSVREKSSLRLLKNIINKDLCICCDPVFLIGKQEWENMIKLNIIRKKYIFCYFIGNNDMGRLAANYISKYKNYAIVYVGNVNCYNKNDKLFLKGLNKSSASPTEFLSLLHDANLILTDSFHAVAFSIIFEKRFICFQRDNNLFMESRIVDLLDSFSLNNNIYLNNNSKKFDYFYHKFDNSDFKYCYNIDIYTKNSKDFLRHCLS